LTSGSISKFSFLPIRISDTLDTDALNSVKNFVPVVSVKSVTAHPAPLTADIVP